MFFGSIRTISNIYRPILYMKICLICILKSDINYLRIAIFKNKYKLDNQMIGLHIINTLY